MRARISKVGQMVGALVALLVVFLQMPSSLASSVSSASFSGGAGTVSVSGTLYAKVGGALTLTVNTSSDTKCVEVTGAQTARQTSSTAKSSWTFNFAAGSGDGLQTVTAAASPNFNSNSCTGQSQSPMNASYVLDNTGPTVTATLVPAPNGAGWNNSNVTINWFASDAGSGVASGPTPASDSQSANTSGVTKTSSATDRLGTTGNGSVTVKLDKMNPTINGNASPGPNGFGWNNTNVTVSFTCSDALSGIKSCTGPTTLTSETSSAGQAVSGAALDNADNNASSSVQVKIDKTAPSLSGAPTTSPNAAGWYNGNVAIHWTCSDGLSGIDGSCPANSTISSEGTALTASASVSDKAGNSTNATSSPSVKIDTTAPNTGASAVNAWNNVAQTVTLTPNDALSSVDATYYKVDGGLPQTGTSVSISSEGDHTFEFWSVDKAGNEETHHTVQVGIDLTPPTILASKSPAANENGWNKTNVTVHFECADQSGLSGIASCTSDQIITTEGTAQPVQGTALDNAGNSVDGYAYVSIDKIPPTIDGGPDRAANGNGWYKDNVVVSFTCGDSLSGIDSCTGPQTLQEGAGQSVTGTAVDAAGNSAQKTISGIDIDKTAPSLSGAATTDPNGNGWYQGDVTVQWACSDALSGIDGSCPANDTVSGEGDNLSASASVYDLAGNSEDATVSGIKIDRTAPVTQIDLPDPVADDWYAGPVQVTLNRSDNLSGVGLTHYSIDDGPAQLYSGPFSFDQNGTHNIRFWSEDKAANVEDSSIPGHQATINIDTVNPSISADRLPIANIFGWNNGSVTVSFTCADGDSGIRVDPPGCPDPVVLSGGGANQSADGTAYDRVGNNASTTLSGINIDRTSPTLSGAATTSPNENGWYKGDVTIHWTADDVLSGIDPPTIPPDSTITGEGNNLGAGPVAVLDKAGNSSGDTFVSGFKIDRTRPVVDSISATVNGDTAAVTVNASDALSSVAGVTINGVATNGSGPFTRNVPLTCGANTISVVAMDKAGNASETATKQVNRGCLWVGPALQPIATNTGSQGNPVANNLTAFKIKSVIPVKFQVYADEAMTQLRTSPPAGGYAKLYLGKYDSSTDSTDSAELVSAGNANVDGFFRWTGSPDYQYIYNLGTSGKAAGTYAVQLTLYAADGSQLAQSAKQYFVLRP
jgi:hypothetical protein